MIPNTLATKQWGTGQPTDRAEVQQKLSQWQNDADFAGIRDATSLAKLAPDEQKSFTQLWADVAALLKKAQETPK